MMHRFFSEKLEADRDILRQLKNVLHFRKGERFILFDGSGYDFISEFDGSGAKILEKVLNRRESERKIFLFQSLLKKDRMEWVFQKGTEVGVFEFVPVLSARSVKKDFNKVRAEKIIKEAAEQSGRAILPKVGGVLEFTEALEFVQKERLSGVIADPNSKKHISETLKEPKMALFVGPEGGFTEEEIGDAKECGFKAVSLGKLNLRSETAALVASAFLVS
ncbi:MAG: RsmE family RNA methyltransferase [bacterium]|nr:RsmE family RNA methyltransferase [bacterium]